MKKVRVGILGATGMVGQRFIQLLENHPWFDVVVLAASKESAGMTYKNAVIKKWNLFSPIPKDIEKIVVKSVYDVEEITKDVDMVFSALHLPSEEIKIIEENYASMGIAVVSNNAAHRWTRDVPMIIPEINGDHTDLIRVQQKNRQWKKGFIVVKPNCSIQSYTSIISALLEYKPAKIQVISLQAISGSGKTFKNWPEMEDNIIPYIAAEEEKSEKEPLKIWGKITNETIQLARNPKISARCIRVPVSNGHMACVSISFDEKISKEAFIKKIDLFNKKVALQKLPSSPQKLIYYDSDDTFPQVRLEREKDRGMAVSMGKLRAGKLFDFDFVSLSHNTIRGAAGGAILLAELLVKKKLIA